jgi:hypothetical protein
VLLVSCGQHIKQGVPTTQHPSPILFDLSQVRKQPRRFIGIEKAGSLVEREDVIDWQSIDLDAVGVVYVRQPREALDYFLV